MRVMAGVRVVRLRYAASVSHAGGDAGARGARRALRADVATRRGGWRSVCGYDREHRAVVAIKPAAARHTGDAAISDRLRREGIALASIDSPHVVASRRRVHARRRVPGDAAVERQHARGRARGANGPVTPARAWPGRARRCSRALGFAHARWSRSRDSQGLRVLLSEGGPSNPC